MTQRLTPEEAEIQQSPWERIRGRIAVTMIGLTGVATVPAALEGCKISIDANLRLANEARLASLDDDGQKIINLVDPEVFIHLWKEGKKVKPDSDEERIVLTGLLQITPAARLYSIDKKEEYQLPKSAYPWRTLTVEPQKNITLVTKDNKLMLVFKCDKWNAETTTFCVGTDTDVLASDNGTDVTDGGNADAMIDAGAAVDAGNGQMDSAVDASTKVAESLKYEGVLNDSVYIGSDTLNPFEPVIEIMDWQQKQALARELASVKEDWKKYVEDRIDKINAAGKGETEKLNLTFTIMQLLKFRPDQIKDVAKKLGVSLNLGQDAGTDASRNPTPEAGSKTEAGVRTVTANNFQSEVLNVKNKPVLVTFWSDECIPCKEQMPILEQLAKEFGQEALFVKVKADDGRNNRLVTKYIMSQDGSIYIPAFGVFKNGQLVQKMFGLQSIAQLQATLGPYLPTI